MDQRRILLGVIGRPHGVRGLVHVHSHTADPADLTAYGDLSDAKGRHFVLRWRGEGVAEVSVVVDGVPAPVKDRDAAAKLTRTELFIDRDRLPPAEEDEFYLSDLVGLAVFDAAGTKLGKVAMVHDYGAGASLEIEGDGKPLIIPFTRACVPVVDITGGRVVIELPAEIDVPDVAEHSDKERAA